jgi:hypothetical protein
MIVLISGLALFFIAYFIHATVWRIRPPRHEWRTLIFIFSGVTATALAVVPYGSETQRLGLTLPRFVLTLFLFGGLSIVYLILFSALQADSPTLTMIRVIRHHRTDGITTAELSANFASRSYPRERLDRMIEDGLVQSVDGRLRIAPQGKRFASVVLSYRELLRRPSASPSSRDAPAEGDS